MKFRRSINLVLGALWLQLTASITLALLAFAKGTQVLEIFSTEWANLGISLSFRFDTLSAPIFVMVSTLALVVGHYSKRYLDGENLQMYFYRYMIGLVISVSGLVLANDLIMFFVMWVLTSFNLHRLLLFFPDRPNAQMAATKKQIVSRLGDLAILSAIVLIIKSYGTTNLNDLFSNSNGTPSPFLSEAIGLLLALGAITKSAQVPFHAWLPETMETPTPVSALMHAGVINAGGYLFIRFSPILQDSFLAHRLLILIGSFTAVYASLVMITQNNIKSKLAYSTISQMGMMLFACGLGAYSIALFHIVAHSFYKAHAFLSTGQIIEESKKVGFKLKPPSKTMISFSMTVGILLITAGYFLWDGTYFPIITYTAVMLVALSQNTFAIPSDEFNPRSVFVSIISLLFCGFLVYITFEGSTSRYLTGIVPNFTTTHDMARANIIPILCAYFMFMSGYVLSGKLMAPKSELEKRIYIHLWNGGYFGNTADRWVSMFKKREISSPKRLSENRYLK